MDDRLAIDRLRGNGGISTLLARPVAAGDAPEIDGTEALPDPAEAYQAHARPAAKALTGIHFLMADQTIVNFQYAELSSRNAFVPWEESVKGNLLTLRFAGLEAVEIRISGRNLKPLFDLVTQHRVAWVAQLPERQNFRDDSAAVVTAILIGKLNF